MNKKIKGIIMTFLFSAILFSVSAVCVFKSPDEYSVSERRPLAQMPEFKLSDISGGKFASEFEAASSDQFPFRESLRSAKAFISYNILGKADNNGVFKADGHLSKLEDAENKEMTDYAAEKFKFIYESFIKPNNAKAYFAMGPDKNYYIAEKNGYPALDFKAFSESFAEKTPFLTHIDITDMLSADSYYYSDTHWRQEKIIPVAEKIASQMGVFLNSDYEIKNLHNLFRGVYSGQYGLPFSSDSLDYLVNDTINACEVYYYDTGKAEKGEIYNTEKGNGRDSYEFFLSGSTPLAVIESPLAKTDKELIILRDSFGSSIAPLFASSYRKITVADIRYMSSNYLDKFAEFENADVLFIYSSSLINNSKAMK